MSRWRPPQATSTAIITADGHRRLKAELDELWRVRRPEVVKALAAGDGVNGNERPFTRSFPYIAGPNEKAVNTQ